MKTEDMIPETFRGCVAIRRGGRDLIRQASGYADLPNRIPNTVETRFASASAGKVFVAAGILRLIEQGEMALDSTLGQLLDMDLQRIDRDITVEQLLCHTSGIPDYFDETVMEDYELLWKDFPNYRIRCNCDLLPLFIDKPMMYAPGTRFQYNNSGYVMLALIMERVTGLPFDAYLQKAVFDTCGMARTGYYELDRLPAGCADSYIFDSENRSWRTNIFSVDAKGTGAGGAFVTVEDILRFWEHLLAGDLLSIEMTREMLRIHSRPDGQGKSCYGYGVWLRTENGSLTPFFQGCDPGVSFMSEYDPDTRTVAVAVSNYGDDVWEVVRRIRRHFFGTAGEAVISRPF